MIQLTFASMIDLPSIGWPQIGLPHPNLWQITLFFLLNILSNIIIQYGELQYLLGFQKHQPTYGTKFDGRSTHFPADSNFELQNRDEQYDQCADQWVDNVNLGTSGNTQTG